MKKNKSKVEQINELFESWKIKQQKDLSIKNKTANKNITNRHFCADGIIDESIYEKEKIKVLFITNEANDAAYTGKDRIETSRIEDFKTYSISGKDEWKGKMRERICALYKVIINNYSIPEPQVACKFAFMNLNKRGGESTVGEYIEYYVKDYAEEIKKEIEIINPDIIVWLGIKTYDMNLHIKYLGAEKIDDKVYLNIDDKKVPILRMWHTSYYRAKNVPMKNFKDKRIGKLATKLQEEMKRYGL